MAGCKNDVICKHFVLTSFTECVRKDICKFFDMGDKVVAVSTAKPVKRKYTRKGKADFDDKIDPDDSGITEKQFKKARKKIANAQQNGKLDENQKLALSSLKGVRFKNATAAQKEQVINMARDL